MPDLRHNRRASFTTECLYIGARLGPYDILALIGSGGISRLQ